MLRYYLQLLKTIPTVFRGTWEGWVFWIGTSAAALAFVKPDLFAALQTRTGPWSRWYGFGAFAFAALYAVARANWLEIKRRDERLAQLDVQQEQLPVIDVHPETRTGTQALVVTNLGGEGRFLANVQVKAVGPDTGYHDQDMQPFRLFWESAGSNEAFLPSSESDWFYFYLIETHAPNGHVVRIGSAARGRAGPHLTWNQSMKAEDRWADVELTINTAPKAARGTWSQCYRIYKDRYEER